MVIMLRELTTDPTFIIDPMEKQVTNERRPICPSAAAE
jgi:hypothetical protein